MEQTYVTKPKFWCGIDVSKATLDIHLNPGDTTWRVDNDPAGHEELVAELKKATAGEVKILMEATGGLERPVLAALAAAGLVVVVVNPRQARRFAECLSANPAKTDRADARMLALMCESVPLEARPLPSQAQRELSELVARRRQLVEMLGREKMRLGQATTTRVRRDVTATIEWLESRVRDLDDDIGRHLEKIEELVEIQEVVRQEKGVGKVTARVLVACLPELGRLSRQKIASLVGVAPPPRDSGKSSAPRHICGGRADVRSALWMATFTARQRNPKIRDHFERLINKGKHYKVAMVACMRKLLTILNAKVHRHLNAQPLPSTPPKNLSISTPC